MSTYDITEKSQNFVCEPIAQYSRQCKTMQLSLFPKTKVATSPHDIKVVELFAGVGGFRIGLERASSRYKTVWNNQWEPSTKRQDASIIYCRRFGTDGHSNEDISLVPTSEIPSADVLVGGFPCQDYSVATTLKHSAGIEGKKGVLWWQIYRILLEKGDERPRFLILENVDRLLRSPAKQRGRDFAIILASLADLGYVVEWRVINAADYGMPQRRRRTYMVAYQNREPIASRIDNAAEWLLRDGIMARAFPVEAKAELAVKSFNINGTLAEVSEGFNKEREICRFENAGIMTNRQVHTISTIASYNGMAIMLRDILVAEQDVPEEYYVSDEDLTKWAYLKGSKSEMRTNAAGYEYKYSEGSMTFPDNINTPSRTIITGEGGAAPSRFKHIIKTPSGRYRRLLPIELERLNMFPDNHTEGATPVRRAFLMGNALVTGIVEKIGVQLLSEF